MNFSVSSVDAFIRVYFLYYLVVRQEKKLQEGKKIIFHSRLEIVKFSCNFVHVKTTTSVHKLTI